MKPAPAMLAVVLACAGCGGETAEPGGTQATAAALPAAYRSDDCAAVLGEYGRAIARGDWRIAALAWEGGAGEGGAGQAARLEREFRGIDRPALTFEPVMVTDGPATRLCVAGVTLRDASGAPPRVGTVSLARAMGVPGATPDEARWRIDDLTVSDPMERVDRGDPG